MLPVPILSQSLIPTVVASSGNSSEYNNVSLSWTLGEIAIETLEAETIILTQGFHQGDLLVDAVEKVIDENFRIIIYPNPTSQSVTIELIRKEPVKVFIEVIDMNGKLLSIKRIEETKNKAEIDFGLYSPATYYLRIKTADQQVNVTYPVQKIN
jgi:hypothetical protein